VNGYELDFYWKTRRVAVEVDGFGPHSSRRAFVSDRRRDMALAAAGIQVIRVSYDQLTKERDRVLVQLALALAAPRS
jgi:very-short-patch-repair endonuclease